MNKLMMAFLGAVLLASIAAAQQVPANALVAIVKAEDARRYARALEDLLKNAVPAVRRRAALAAGRIGREEAIPALVRLLEGDADASVRSMAAFALGEIESARAADAIRQALNDAKAEPAVRARLVEAAGKIAAANAKDASSPALGRAIVAALEAEAGRGAAADRDVVLLGLTAVLRARPEGGDVVAAKFLSSADARVRADAGNTLTRLRAKNANPALRQMLAADAEPLARANAARALGAAEDREALAALLKAAAEDADARVRVAAIRSLAALKDRAAGDALLARGERLLADFKRSKANAPDEKSELLEIAAALGRVLPAAGDERAVVFLDGLRVADKFVSPETEIALARVAPEVYLNWVAGEAGVLFANDWRAASSVFQGLGEFANLPASAENDALKSRVRVLLVQLTAAWIDAESKEAVTPGMRLAAPDLIRAFAAFKSENTSGIFRPILDLEPDAVIRATVAEVLGTQPPSRENADALKKAFAASLAADKRDNDAQLAILDALAKIDKKEAVGVALTALQAPDYLVRRKAFEILRDESLKQDFPGLEASLKTAARRKKDEVLAYAPRSGTRLGQVTLTDADYRRAVARKNGSVRAVFATEKGAFTIELAPEDAPLTVDNFVRLARAGYFNGLAVHRVVPNFVMQDGDPRGDGNGGPGWSIRCEINLLAYERGAVGMALSGKDTGGSQWFVTHSPQPHLDGGYTVFGKVSEEGMKTVDRIVRGDKILSVKIVEGTGKAPVRRKR